MKRLIIILFSLILLSSCVTTKKDDVSQLDKYNKQIQHDLSLLNLSKYKDNVYVGVSSPYSTKEKMLEAAIINVAKNISIEDYLVLNKLLISEDKSNLGTTYFETKELFVYQDEKIPKIIEALDILEIYFSSEAGCIVIAEDTRKVGKERIYKAQYDENGYPTWITERPKIDSYIVGVGSTLAYRLFVDSIYAADHEAIYDISSQYGSETSYLQNYFGMVQNNYSTFSKEGKVHQELAVVKKIQRIDYWYDQSNNLFYSLIIMEDDRGE